MRNKLEIDLCVTIIDRVLSFDLPMNRCEQQNILYIEMGPPLLAYSKKIYANSCCAMAHQR